MCTKFSGTGIDKTSLANFLHKNSHKNSDNIINNLHTIRYDSVYLTCSKKLTGSQLSLQHGINKKIKCETKNKMVSVIGPVQCIHMYTCATKFGANACRSP